MSAFKNLPPSYKGALMALLVSTLAFVALHAGYRVLLMNQNEIAPELLGVVLPTPRAVNDFTLKDHRGEPFTLKNMQGRWNFLFFGYTHCPDVCPVTMGLLADVFKRLKEHPMALQQSQGIFVSVDAKRDQANVLKDYVTYFNEAFIGVTADDDTIKKFTSGLGVAFKSSAVEADGNYLIAHSTGIYLIDPQGRFYALFQPQHHNAEKIVALFLEIVKSYR
ncbi:MAG: SCO family protein [Magnetococcales bacterium]|nr:SCO family protein [Magnetococcales bacterium]